MSMTPFSLSGKRVFVAGHRGMVGSALMRALEKKDCVLIVGGRDKVDLRRQNETEHFLKDECPDLIFVAAATVGGIMANSTRPAEFLYDNLVIETNIIEGARQANVSKLVFLGSTCIYPKLAEQPIREDSLLTGPLEPTNEWYAIAKIAGIKMCDAYRRQYGCDFISAQPTNLYGPYDNYDLQNSHVVPALMRKMHEAKLSQSKEVEIWGSGKPLREFLHVDDLANALIFLAEHYSEEGHVNVGTGEEISIGGLADVLADIVGFKGDLVFNTEKPDGTPRKLTDVTKINSLGWKASIALREGLTDSYAWFLEHVVKNELRGIGS